LVKAALDARHFVIKRRQKSFIFRNLPLRRRYISVFIGVSTHSHVPMAHGGYATT
jgi:hypothetical protein